MDGASDNESAVPPILVVSPTSIDEQLPLHDPLLSFVPKTDYALSSSIVKKRSAYLTPQEFEQCFHLVKTTSSADYKASSSGWHPNAKKQEMLDDNMWYLLVRRKNAEQDASLSSPRSADMHPIIGFLSFMFTHDDDPPDRTVGYIYEVHIHDTARGSGLGSHLIHIAETLARRCGVLKTMLTVFTANKRALDLYRKLGYAKDACSPADRMMRRRVIEAEYRILSKEHTVM